MSIARYPDVVCRRENEIQIRGNQSQEARLGARQRGDERVDWKNIKPIDEKLRLNIGARFNTHPKPRYKGWIGVDAVYKKPNDYQIKHSFPKLMGLAPNTVDSILTEHFLEHLPERFVKAILKDCFRILKPSCRIRLAVPDFNHPLYTHMREAKKDDNPLHRSMWTVDAILSSLQEAGFTRIVPMQYWIVYNDHDPTTRSFQFIERVIDESFGIIKRTPKRDRRNKKNLDWGRLHMTSLVVDAIKLEDGVGG